MSPPLQNTHLELYCCLFFFFFIMYWLISPLPPVSQCESQTSVTPKHITVLVCTSLIRISCLLMMLQ